MTVEMALLAAGAALVLGATLAGRQLLLLVGVVIYGAMTLWVAYVHPPLILPALLGAIGLEVVGLRRVLRQSGAAADAEADATSRHNSARIVPSKIGTAGGR